MKCKKCNSEMKIGKAFDIKHEICRYIMPHNSTLKNPILIDCWKCPKCGHSEYLCIDDAPPFCQYSASSL